MDLAVPENNEKKRKESRKKEEEEEEEKTDKAAERVSEGVSTTSSFSTPIPATLAPDSDELRAAVENKVQHLLHALHVGARYTSQTGKELPVEADYFFDCLTGKVMPVGTPFGVSLAQSVRQVGCYLYVRVSSSLP